MPIIESDRWMPGDYDHWLEESEYDHVRAKLSVFQRRVDRSLNAIDGFLRDGDSGYLGVSWGKDSVVTAHLVRQVAPDYPLVWVRIVPQYNPDCPDVRDAWLDAYPDTNYHEYEAPWWPEQKEAWADLARDHHGMRSLGLSFDKSAAAQGFKVARSRHGKRHISGVRAQEARVRRLRMITHGESSPNTCAPIGWWEIEDVFAYLALHDLPVHPAYAQTYGGRMSRDDIRVDALGGATGSGRMAWEGRYYTEEIHRIKQRALE